MIVVDTNVISYFCLTSDFSGQSCIYSGILGKILKW